MNIKFLLFFYVLSLSLTSMANSIKLENKALQCLRSMAIDFRMSEDLENILPVIYNLSLEYKALLLDQDPDFNAYIVACKNEKKQMKSLFKTSKSVSVLDKKIDFGEYKRDSVKEKIVQTNIAQSAAFAAKQKEKINKFILENNNFEDVSTRRFLFNLFFPVSRCEVTRNNLAAAGFLGLSVGGGSVKCESTDGTVRRFVGAGLGLGLGLKVDLTRRTDIFYILDYELSAIKISSGYLLTSSALMFKGAGASASSFSSSFEREENTEEDIVVFGLGFGGHGEVSTYIRTWFNDNHDINYESLKMKLVAEGAL